MKKIRLVFRLLLIVWCLKGFVMFSGLQEQHDFSANVTRRKQLLDLIKQEYPEVKKGIVLLFGAFESDRSVFWQESSFFYLTGIAEPSLALALDLSGKSSLYVPNFDGDRSQWMFSTIALTQDNAAKVGVDEIAFLGDPCKGYQLHPFFSSEEYCALLDRLRMVLDDGGKLFVLNPSNANEYVDSCFILERLASFIPHISDHYIDISYLLARQRRIKDRQEMERLFKSVEITAMAHEAAAQAIEDGTPECEVQASLEYIYTAAGAHKGFPSIVASGNNSTTLHYLANNATMRNGDLVVVDIGSCYEGYIADLTRTYPVSGTFTDRQREIYNLVLATQEYIASIAKPGYWLRNAEKEEKSLHHLAHKYLQEHGGYSKYFTHGLGHYLGLDVHDVGDYGVPLQEGDVITIEPGLYIPEEGIGVRIEDNYWIVKDGAICLSEHLPKKAEEIEAMVQSSFSDEDDLEQDPDFGYDHNDELLGRG